MSEAPRGELPRPTIRRVRWPVYLIWIVPLVAAGMAMFYYLDYHRHHAKEIIIRFSTAEGLKPGQTPINHLGVEVGMVSKVELSPDRNAALVHVQLNQATEDLAKQGMVFWIERAELSAENISGLSTVVSGPYIDYIPGTGAPATEFAGLDEKPLVQGPGLRIVVRSPQLQHVQHGSPVYFRGYQVGTVEKVELNQVASEVIVHLFIHDRYAPLVRESTKFWIESGIDVSGGIFSGVKMNVGSLRSIISGGIVFATPNAKAAAAQDGWSFPLYDEPDKDWQEWKTDITLAPETGKDQERNKATPSGTLSKMEHSIGK